MVGMPGSGAGGIPGLHPGLFRAPSYDSDGGTESGPASRSSNAPPSSSRSSNPSSLGGLN